ncbi:hypothetical protein [Longimicrobium sp.]|uniref:hypothetical protein n=1 Tax=Longimicrobium sp. TaxID=2029185 RepID=UPI002F921FE2
MTRKTLAATLALVLPLSSLLVACGQGEDTSERAVLERRALERDLSLAAITPDTTIEVPGEDGPPVDSAALPQPLSFAAPAPAPRPAPAGQPAPAAERSQPQRSAKAPAERASSGPSYVTRTAPSGSTFSVSFNQQVSTRTMGVGDTFTATLSESLTDGEGRTVIPAGATVRGRVTRARPSGNVTRGTDLAVTFTSIRHNGQTYPIDVTVVGEPGVQRRSRQSAGRKAATIGGGAVVGGVAGRVLGGDRRSTVRGAVVGAAAGTAVAIGGQDIDAVIPAGSSATVRLDAPVRGRREHR